MARRVALTGCFGFQNTGDDAILETWLHELRPLSDVEVVVLGANRTYLQPRYPHVDIRDWRDWDETVETLASVDVLVVAGGGLFHDYCPMDPRLFMEPTPWICPLTYLNLISWAKWLGRPCILTGVGVGPLTTEAGQTYVREVLRWADVLTVRDTASREVLESIGFPEVDRVIVTADPVFRLPRVADDRLPVGFEELGLDKRRPLIGVAIRNWMRDPPFDRWGRELAEALDQVVQSTGGTVLFLPFQIYPPDEEANDRTAAEAVRQWMRHACQAYVVDRYLSPTEAETWVRACDVLVAMRLHAIILGIRNGVPCIGLAYDPKVRHLMVEAGVASYLWDLASVQRDSLARQILSLWNHPEAFRTRAEAYRDIAVRRTEVHFQAVWDYLQNSPMTRQIAPPLWTRWAWEVWADRRAWARRARSAETERAVPDSPAPPPPTVQDDAQRQVAELQDRLAQQDLLIRRITESRAWHLVQGIWWLRPKVAPDGSWRQRFLYWTFRQAQAFLSRGRRRLPVSTPPPQGSIKADPRAEATTSDAVALLHNEKKPALPVSRQTGRKVCIVAPALLDAEGQYLHLGGAERYLLELTRLLQALGHEVEVYQPARGDWQRHFYGVPVYGLDTGGLDKVLMNEVFHRRVRPPDLTIYLDFTLAEPQSFSPSIGISHGVFWDAPGFQHTQQYASVLKAIENLSYVVSVDTNTINWVRTFSGHLTDKMRFVPNFVDLNLFRPASRRRSKSDRSLVILYPRRLHPSRGFHFLQELIPRLTEQYPHVVFWLVGQVFTDQDREILEAILRTHDRRVYWQTCPFEEMPAVYQQADITVIPSVYAEGTSLACLEAMACGNAIVATPVGGLSDLIIHGYNGLLVPPTVEDLHTALESLIEQRDWRTRLGARAREVAAAFSVERWRRAWTQIIRRFLPD